MYEPISGNDHKHEDNQTLQPWFNNQNSILLFSRSKVGYLMLMHETRIFYFEYDGTDKEEIVTRQERDKRYAKAANHMLQLILGILTTRKYRLLTSFYLLWRVLDYVMLAALALLLFFDGKNNTFNKTVEVYIIIFVVIGMEIFYDVLEFIVKIWILNRLSIYIGFILYILYGAAFVYYEKHDYDEDPTVIILFVLRFVSFILEELTDFCIDLELEYDLEKEIVHKFNVYDIFKCLIPKCIEQRMHKYKEHIALLHIYEKGIICPEDWVYRGSKCVWTADSTFECDVNPRGEFNTCYRKVFDVMFIITYCILGVPLLIAMGFIIVLLKMWKMCCSRCSDGKTIFDECCDPNSY